MSSEIKYFSCPDNNAMFSSDKKSKENISLVIISLWLDYKSLKNDFHAWEIVTYERFVQHTAGLA